MCDDCYSSVLVSSTAVSSTGVSATGSFTDSVTSTCYSTTSGASSLT